MPLFNGASIEDYPENLLIRYKDEADGCYKYMRTGAEIEEYIRALFAFSAKTPSLKKYASEQTSPPISPPIGRITSGSDG